MPTRRNFLKQSALVSASVMLPSAQLAALATSGGAATTVRLADGWEYVQSSLGGAWEVWHSEETSVWEKVTIPHSFNAYDGCDPDVAFYKGHGWYRTHVGIANPYEGGRTLLHFEGAGQTTTVYVGDQLAGRHVGGYDEFVLDITDLIADAGKVEGKNAKAGMVPVAVLCDNSRDLERMPSDLSDFSLYGGLYRNVSVVYVPAVSLETLHVKTAIPSPAGAADVEVLGVLYAPVAESAKAAVKFAVEVRDAKGVVVHTSSKTLTGAAGAQTLASFAMAKPQLWSPKTPHLYQCKVTVSGPGGEYVAQETFGVKHTEFVEHGPFKLNGERLLLRGTHRHEDHAGYANAQPAALVEEEMKLVKAMGANFIRLGHYQQSRQVLELCDRLGILVWEEIPWCRAGIGDETFQKMGKEKLRNMIGQHYNHVSVLFWGLGNEDDWPTEYPEINKDKIRAYMKELNDLAHELDASRYTSFRRCAFAQDIPDCYSPSIWAGWYSGTYPEYQASLEKERMKVKHMVHIEWGADSHAGRHSESPDKVLSKIETGKGTDERGLAYLQTGGPARVSRDGDWSETYACNLFDWHLKVQETLPWFTGSAQWVFKDFTTPLRVENPVPRINQKGLIQRDMTKKESYYVFQSYWAEEPMVHVYGHTWPVRWGDAGEMKMVKAYSNCETAEAFLNGKSLGVKKRDSQDYPAAGLRWMTPFAEGKNTLRVVAKKGTATVTDEIAFEYQTTKWGAAAELRLKEKARGTKDGKETVTIEAKLYDAKGVLCLDAKNPVRFSVAGKGSLIDNLGTPQGSRLVQMYNGRAEITLMRNGGASMAAVVTDGVAATFVAIA